MFLLIFLPVILTSGWLTLQYRNSTDGASCSQSILDPIYYKNKQISPNYRDFFFKEKTCFGDGDFGWFKGFSLFDEYYQNLQLQSCTTNCAICENVTSDETFPCPSNMKVNKIRVQPTKCTSFEYPCVNYSDTNGTKFNVRGKQFENIDSLVDYSYRFEFLTVWDGESDCKKLEKSKIFVGKVWRGSSFKSDSGKVISVGLPKSWDVLFNYDGRSKTCVSKDSLSYRCSNSRLIIETYFVPYNHSQGCSDTPNGTYSAEEWFYGENPTCSFKNMKFLCGRSPFLITTDDNNNDESNAFAIIISLCLLISVIFVI